MTSRRRLFTIGLVLALGVSSALAEAPSPASLEELYQTMHVEQTMQQMNEKMAPMAKEMTEQGRSGMPKGPSTIDLTKGMQEHMQKMLPIQKKAFFDVYSENFSESEIQELIRFFKSPLGQKSINIGPQMAQRVMKESMANFKMPPMNNMPMQQRAQ